MTAHPLVAEMEQLARKLWGEPNKDRSTSNDVRFGTHGSKTIRRSTAEWFDHESGDGGGYRELYRLVHGTFPPNGADSGIVAVYDYRDAAGKLLFQVVRKVPKDFRQRRPDGNGGWIWNLKGVDRVPYRLPELLRAGPDATIHVCEGEKDCDHLHALGLVATCNPGGVGKWLPAMSQHLRNRDCVIIPDSDQAGETHARDVARKLCGVAASVRVVRLPGLPPKGDVSDWLAAGGTRAGLEALAAEAPYEGDAPGEPPPENEPPPETDDAAIARLAKLQMLQYERARADEAKRMGIRATLLDKLVAAERGTDGGKPGQGHTLTIARPEPWPEPVALAELLDSISRYLTRHVFLPAGASDALAAWAVHTYVVQQFRHTPRIAFLSPEKRCGKTTALDALGLIVCAPLPTVNLTAPALFRSIEMAEPTLLIDEGDSFLSNNEDLRGVLNAGHKRGGQVVRCVGDDAEPRAFGVFAPAAIAAIGRLADTLMDRAIVVRMQRALRGERPAPLDAVAEVDGARLARMCSRWADDHRGDLVDAQPALPAALFNRAADNWRPLFAIAAAAAGDWPVRIEAASVGLAPDDDGEGRGIRLLADIREVFAGRRLDQIASADLVGALVAIETSPWSDYRHGKPITAHQLARALAQFRIAPRTLWLGAGSTQKGYRADTFAEAWRRYLDDHHAQSEGNGGFKPSGRQVPTESAVSAASEPSGPTPHLTDRISLKPASQAAPDDLTDRKGENRLFTRDEAETGSRGLTDRPCDGWDPVQDAGGITGGPPDDWKVVPDGVEADL